MREFYCKIGIGNALWAELWAIRLGIKLAQQLQLQQVEFELDSKVVVHLILAGATANVHMQLLLHDIIHSLRQPDLRASVIHVYREANLCEDFLANLGHSSLSFD